MKMQETIMEGHIHEHGPLYIGVPFVMFDEGGVGGVEWSGVEWGGVVWCGVVWCGVVVVVVVVLHPSVLPLVRRITLPSQLCLCP